MSTHSKKMNLDRIPLMRTLQMFKNGESNSAGNGAKHGGPVEARRPGF